MRFIAQFCYDGPFVSPATFNEDTLVVDGFGKTYGCTGWRLGYAHGPQAIIEQMQKLQQFTFVCPPSAFQHAAVAAWHCDISGIVADYKQKRDRLVNGLRGRYEFVRPRRRVLRVSESAWKIGDRVRHTSMWSGICCSLAVDIQPSRYAFSSECRRRRRRFGPGYCHIERIGE